MKGRPKPCPHSDQVKPNIHNTQQNAISRMGGGKRGGGKNCRPKVDREFEGDTKMRSKRVFWSTLTNSASQALSSSSEEDRSSEDLAAAASTCFLQYSMTLERILPVTLGSGMALSAQSSSIMCLMVCDSNATASSTSKVSPSELFRVTFFPEDMIDPPNETLPSVNGERN